MEIHTLNLALDCMCEDHAINGVHVVLRFGFSEHVHFSCRVDHIVIASFFVNTKIVSPHIRFLPSCLNLIQREQEEVTLILPSLLTIQNSSSVFVTFDLPYFYFFVLSEMFGTFLTIGKVFFSCMKYKEIMMAWLPYMNIAKLFYIQIQFCSPNAAGSILKVAN